MADVNQRQAMYTKLSEIDLKVRQDYIGGIDDTVLMDGICAGYVAGLSDPNGKYLSAERYKAYLEGTSGGNVGVGILTIQDDDGNMEIVEVFPNSSAEKSGLKKGDVITAIDDQEVVRLTYGEAATRLDGTAGSTVKFTLLRTDETTGELVRETVSVTRTEYLSSPVKNKMINGNVGYISVSQFSKDAGQQFLDALDELVKSGASGIVVDLRNNSGGLVDEMALAADELLPAGNIVSYVDKDGKSTAEYTSDADALGLPISVIVNKGTYGAAELFAANIADYKKGKVIGEVTAGSGTKQDVIALSDGSAVIISVAQYVRVDGTQITGVGVTPDMEISLSEEQEELLLRNSLDPSEDPQVQAAITALISQGAQVQQVPGAESSEPEESAPEEAAEEGDSTESTAEEVQEEA